MTRVGVLAVQGDFREHLRILRRIGVDTSEIRLPHQLEDIDAIIIPGGESTTICRLMDIYGLREPLKERIRSGMATWGTCAGMIVVADKLTDERPTPMGLMNIEVSRNAFGRQVDSFETDLEIAGLSEEPFRAVFIRAPLVRSVGDGVDVLAKLEDGTMVAVKQGHMLATSFHPELTDDTRVHRLFLDMVGDSK